MDAAVFARQFNLAESRITEILNRRQAVTEDVALRLAEYFGTSAEFWVNLQRIRDRRLAANAFAQNTVRTGKQRRCTDMMP